MLKDNNKIVAVNRAKLDSPSSLSCNTPMLCSADRPTKRQPRFGPLEVCALSLQNAVVNNLEGASSRHALFKGGMPRTLICADNPFVDL